jgi:4-amino-4-deoxy-L-arabinose transferase-like glycosyltransferase
MKKQTFLELLILLCILFVAADLRLSNIAETPGWYNDEGTIINITTNLVQGKFEYLGLKDSILIASRQPLFPCLLAILFKIFGVGIVTLRAFTGALGVLNTLLIYLVLRKEDKALTLVCALCFAILPEAVLYSRVGFSYNLVATLVLLAVWASFRYLEKGSGKYIYLTAIILGLGFISEIAAVAFLPVLLILALWKNWKQVFLAALLYFVPFGIYSCAMLLISPQAYLYDINFIFFRVSSLSVLLKGILFTMNMARIGDFLLIFAGLLGIIFCQVPRVQKLIGLYLYIPFLVIGTSTGITWLGEWGVFCCRHSGKCTSFAKKSLPAFKYVSRG